MKTGSIFFLSLVLSISAAAQQIPIIPLPNQFIKVAGDFNLSNSTPVVAAGEAAEKAAKFFQKELLRSAGIAVYSLNESKLPQISIRLRSGFVKNPDVYSLTMSSEAVSITASDEKGLFNGVISLLQLIRKAQLKDGHVTLPCWKIEDAPEYGWRGFMLDESRHFFGKQKVKQILDWMSFYKLNRFHWHLTDQAGWRIEIQQYPRLTLVGGIGNHTDKNAAAKFYTQDDINEIVSYAAERHIDIIPEIDMPGHATAANMAYPEYSGGGNEAHPEFTFNPGKESVYSYLSTILREVDALFPSQMIHLGADEVSFGTDKWLTNPDVIRLMKEKQLKDIKAVEYYFNRRIADTISKLNNKVLAWDEAVDAGLPVKNTVIFWWRHDKPAQLSSALNNGYDVVLCPRLPMYFDFVQDSAHTVGRRWDGKFSSLDKVYNFSAAQYVPDKKQTAQVLGIQANLWTETVETEARLDYLLFPRISALAEAAWTKPQNKSYSEFKVRLNDDMILFDKEDIYYFDPFSVYKHSEPGAIQRKSNAQ